MSQMISSDGHEWREVSDEEFRMLMADVSVDCWVDLTESDYRSPMRITFDSIRTLPDNLKKMRLIDCGEKPTKIQKMLLAIS